jgi:membrane dipeptidase
MAQSTKIAETDAAAVYSKAIVWDMVLPIDPLLGNDFSLLDRYVSSGCTYVSLTLAGDDAVTGETLHRIGAARSHILARPDRYILVEKVADVRRAKSEGKLAVGLHFEGTRVLERDLSLIEVYYKLGIRHSILAFNKTNSAGGGCAERNDPGLTRFGELVVQEMSRVGMLLDLSHTGYRTTMDAMSLNEGPVVFTHSNVDRLRPHFRNLKDDQIRMCAERNGVVGISGSSIYLGDPESKPETIFSHIDYICSLVGARHAGIGLDLVGDAALAKRWMMSRPDEWPGGPGTIDPFYSGPEVIVKLADWMVRAGYDEDDILGVLGGNFLRVCEAVWK